MANSQIASILSGLNVSAIAFFHALEEKCNTINKDRFFLMFLDILAVP